MAVKNAEKLIRLQTEQITVSAAEYIADKYNIGDVYDKNGVESGEREEKGVPEKLSEARQESPPDNGRDQGTPSQKNERIR